MAKRKKDRVELLQRGVPIARRYQRAKCEALRTCGRGRRIHFEEDLRALSPRFDSACKDWYEWYGELQRDYPLDNSEGLWAVPIDWTIRGY